MMLEDSRRTLRSMPFQRLMETVESMSDDEKKMTLGELSTLWTEPIDRVMDAIDAVRYKAGEQTYL